MKRIQELIHQEWTEFFPSSEQRTKYFMQNKTLISGDNSYYICFCNFGRLLTEGAIFFLTNKDTTKSLIETTNFHYCSNTKKSGGCLFFHSRGEIVQNRICSFNSKSSRGSMYCYVQVSGIAQFKNKILNSFISKSGYINENEYINICLRNGEIEVNSINISYTYIYSNSILDMYYYNSPSSASFSTFSNNTDTYSISNSYSIYFSGSSETLFIKSCNYLSNNLHAIITADHACVYFINCSFVKNTGRSCYFYHGFLGNTTFDGCYIDVSNPITKAHDSTINVFFKNKVLNPVKIEIPNISCEFAIPNSMDEEDNDEEIVYINRNMNNIKNIHLIFSQSFIVFSGLK